MSNNSTLSLVTLVSKDGEEVKLILDNSRATKLFKFPREWRISEVKDADLDINTADTKDVTPLTRHEQIEFTGFTTNPPMSFGSPSVTKATVHYYDEDKENDHQDDIKSFKEVQEYLYGSPEEYLEIIAEDKLRGLKVRLYLPTGDKSSILNGYVQVWADPSSLTNWMEKMLDHEFQQKTKQLANLDTRIRKASAYLEGNLD